MWLHVTLDYKELLLVYIPPSGSPYSDFKEFHQVGAELDTFTFSKHIEICLAGDFNAGCCVKSEYLAEAEI